MVLYNCDILDTDASIRRTLCPDELTLRGDTVYSHSLVLLRPLRIALSWVLHESQGRVRSAGVQLFSVFLEL